MFYMVSFLLPYTQDRAHHSSSEDFIKRPLKKIPPTTLPFSIDSKISSAMNMNLRFLGKLKKREKEKSQ